MEQQYIKFLSRCQLREICDKMQLRKLLQVWESNGIGISVDAKVFVLQNSITKNFGETSLGNFIRKDKLL